MRVRRVLAISTIAVVAILVAALLILHTNPVQSRLLNWSIAELERRFDLKLSADNLHYNLARRRVTLTNVKLAALGHLDQPFFSANAITVQLPWAAYRGRLRFDDIAVDQGRVNVYRDATGVSNLPPGRGRRDPNAPPRRIDARGLTVRESELLVPRPAARHRGVRGARAHRPRLRDRRRRQRTVRHRERSGRAHRQAQGRRGTGEGHRRVRRHEPGACRHRHQERRRRHHGRWIDHARPR